MSRMAVFSLGLAGLGAGLVFLGHQVATPQPDRSTSGALMGITLGAVGGAVYAGAISTMFNSP